MTMTTLVRSMTIALGIVAFAESDLTARLKPRATNAVVEASAGPANVRIIQTNSAGDNVSLIDPATNKVVAEITGIEVNHGAAAARDGSQLYFSNEADHTLDVVSGKTLTVTKKIALSGPPNNISICP